VYLSYTAFQIFRTPSPDVKSEPYRFPVFLPSFRTYLKGM
jgi:hypothetical protein